MRGAPGRRAHGRRAHGRRDAARQRRVSARPRTAAAASAREPQAREGLGRGAKDDEAEAEDGERGKDANANECMLLGGTHIEQWEVRVGELAAEVHGAWRRAAVERRRRRRRAAVVGGPIGRVDVVALYEHQQDDVRDNGHADLGGRVINPRLANPRARLGDKVEHVHDDDGEHHHRPRDPLFLLILHARRVSPLEACHVGVPATDVT